MIDCDADSSLDSRAHRRLSFAHGVPDTLALRELSALAGRLAREVGSVRYTAVRREHNVLADRLVNEALDAAS